MAAEVPTILATTMGFHRGGRSWTPGPVFDLAFELAARPARPRLCFVTTGTGDSPASIAGFYSAFAGSAARVSHLALFEMPNVHDVAGHLLGQDVIWVDRGSLVNLVAVWRAHGVDDVLRRCRQSGVVLAGESAGSLCWHSTATTDSFGPQLDAVEGLGLLPFANAVHYEHRRKHFHALMRSGALPSVDIAVQEYGRYFGLNTATFRCGTLTGPAHAAAELHGFLAYLMRCAMSHRTYRISATRANRSATPSTPTTWSPRSRRSSAPRARARSTTWAAAGTPTQV